MLNDESKLIGLEGNGGIKNDAITENIYICGSMENGDPAALSRYGEAIREVTRITEIKRELGESGREELDRKQAS